MLVHPDHWPTEIPEKVRQLLQATSSGQRRLNEWLTEHMSLNLHHAYDFETPRHRLALLEPAQLEALLWRYTAAVHAKAITQAIDRESQTKYRETLGESTHRFALKRASFLTRGLPEELQPHPSAEVIESSLLRECLVCLAHSLADLPSELLPRVQLMLPAKFSAGFPRIAVNPENIDEIWRLTRQILLTEIAPGVGPCFN